MAFSMLSDESRNDTYTRKVDAIYEYLVEF